jgi:hypothetical protein
MMNASAEQYNAETTDTTVAAKEKSFQSNMPLPGHLQQSHSHGFGGKS